MNRKHATASAGLLVIVVMVAINGEPTQSQPVPKPDPISTPIEQPVEAPKWPAQAPTAEPAIEWPTGLADAFEAVTDPSIVPREGSGTLEVGEWGVYDVEGVPNQKRLAEAQLFYYPRDGVDVVKGDSATWNLDPGEPDPWAMFRATKSGKYLLVIAVFGKPEGSNRGRVILGEYEVVVTGDDPDPPDPPVPPDPPDPPVPGTELWGYIVYESADMIGERGVVLQSKELRETFEPHHLRKADDDNTEDPDMQPWIAKAKTLPYWFLVDENGNVLHEGPFPDRVSEAVALAEQFRPAGRARAVKPDLPLPATKPKAAKPTFPPVAIVVLGFKGCSECVTMAPVIRRMQADKYVMSYFDINEYPKFAAQFDVRYGYPHFAFLQDGKVVQQHDGVICEELLRYRYQKAFNVRAGLAKWAPDKRYTKAEEN
ncbi:MAG: thioredoxin family protein [Planctomycetes bacterium]|nr:thioredoxin family protein [Planctomycetota bacterium]